jgi:hypothetical protein
MIKSTLLSNPTSAAAYYSCSVLLVLLLVESKKSIEVGVTQPALLTADEYSHSLSGSIVD